MFIPKPWAAALALSVLLLGGCKVGRFVIYNFADSDDYRKFPSRPLPASPSPWEYPAAAVEHGPRTITYDGKEMAFDAFLEAHRTVAFLVVRRDTVIYERYFKGYDPSHLHASFSMAKSVTSMLVGCAVADGYIRSVQQPVTDFIPELKGNGFDRVTVEQLLQMTGGLKFNESYSNPFGDAATYYYGRRLYRYMGRMKLAHEPGTRFAYQSGSTQLLGWVLERALRQHNDRRTITEYLNDKLWAPLGMVYPASWSIDRKKGGIEKTFCCLNAPARDFAKLGSLYLHDGNWQGRQLVPAAWVEQSTRVDTTGNSAWNYQYQWWLPSRDGDFMAHGLLGQYTYVDPARELVIVRLGTKEGGIPWGNLLHNLARDWPAE
ncbi:MAG: serine hydrolase [Flavobacteriales bacterium]|nr:serine hydrolase [Flavobacteriales bacterium]MEB2342203.1 serine hydrolase [Flavobacteriia bacterium]